MFDSEVREIQRRLPALEIRTGEPMSRHCSFKIGGICAAMVFPKSAGEVAEICRVLRSGGISPLVIGNGTNLLVTDKALPRFVIKFGEDMSAILPDGDNGFFAESGCTLSKLAGSARSAALAGLEFAAGIPGSLGGAVVMNAGAYGGEMKDVVTSVRYLDSDLCECEKRGSDLDFSYRHSAFSSGGDIILGCTVRLQPGDPEAIGARMRELAEKRRASQPLELPSAGSTFKRPKTGYAAALIDEAGLKGFSIGGAQVSEKHAGFVVNRGSASFDDVLAVMDHVRETVFARSGIELEPEVRIITG